MSSVADSGYMLFSAGGRRYALSIGLVGEISELLPQYPIPGAPRFIRGAVNIHGKIAALLDISMFLGTGVIRQGGSIILLDGEGACLGLLVDQTERIAYPDDYTVETGENGSSLILADGRAQIVDAGLLLEAVEKGM